MDSLDDYYFRDSFDQSSSESQIQERAPGGASHRSSRSQTPQPPMRIRSGSRGSVNTVQMVPAGAIIPAPAPPTTGTATVTSKRFNLVQVCYFLLTKSN